MALQRARNLRKARCDTRSSRASGTTYELGMVCAKHRGHDWLDLRGVGGRLPCGTTSRVGSVEAAPCDDFGEKERALAVSFCRTTSVIQERRKSQRTDLTKRPTFRLRDRACAARSSMGVLDRFLSAKVDRRTSRQRGRELASLGPYGRKQRHGEKQQRQMDAGGR